MQGLHNKTIFYWAEFYVMRRTLPHSDAMDWRIFSYTAQQSTQLYSFYVCKWKPLMGDSLFNYKARRTDIHDGLPLPFCCCYPEACCCCVCTQHGTLIRTRKIENSIVQFNKFNFHLRCRLRSCQTSFHPKFYWLLSGTVCCWLRVRMRVESGAVVENASGRQGVNSELRYKTPFSARRR